MVSGIRYLVSGILHRPNRLSDCQWVESFGHVWSGPKWSSLTWSCALVHRPRLTLSSSCSSRARPNRFAFRSKHILALQRPCSLPTGTIEVLRYHLGQHRSHTHAASRGAGGGPWRSSCRAGIWYLVYRTGPIACPIVNGYSPSGHVGADIYWNSAKPKIHWHGVEH